MVALKGLRRSSGLALVLGPWLAAGPLAAQAHLVRADLEAALGRDHEPATMALRYRLAPSGQAQVPIAVLLFGGTGLGDLRAEAEGRVLAVPGLAGTGPRRTGTLVLPADLVGAAEVTVDVSYTVEGAIDRGLRASLPVVAVLWPPREAVPGSFRATISLPPGRVAWDGLPSVLRPIETPAGRRYAVDLAVVPAVVAFRVGERVPRLRLAGVLDGTVIVLLLGLGILAWRRLREDA